jgi:rhamnosyltransferase
MNDRVAAVIVAFHPDEQRLRTLQAFLQHERVGFIYIVDNTPTSTQNSDLVEPGVMRIRLGRNTGIAHAQNVGIEMALRAGHTHVMLFDQDSELPEGLVAGLLDAEAKLLAAGQRVAAVGPAFYDRKSGIEAVAVHFRWWGVKKTSLRDARQPVQTDSIIASGSLIRSEVLRTVGGMVDHLFIDWVDIEWALRAKRFGFACFITPTVKMSHSIGESAVNFAGRFYNIHKSKMRKFHIIRNGIVLARLRYVSRASRMGIVCKVVFKYIPGYLILGRSERADLLRLLASAVLEGLRIKRADLRPTLFDR